MKFYDAIVDMNSCNIVLAKLSKNEVKEIFSVANVLPKNSDMIPDDTYDSGEVHFVFDKADDSLNEVLVYPCYSDLNGDFLNAPDKYWDMEKDARDYLLDA